MLPPPHLDGRERLAWYQAAKAREEDRVVIENFARKIAAVAKEKADQEREKRDREKRAG